MFRDKSVARCCEACVVCRSPHLDLVSAESDNILPTYALLKCQSLCVLMFVSIGTDGQTDFDAYTSCVLGCSSSEKGVIFCLFSWLVGWALFSFSFFFFFFFF